MSKLNYQTPYSRATYATPKTLYRITFCPSRKGKGEMIWMIHEDVTYKLVEQGIAKGFKEAEACVLAVLEGGVSPTTSKPKTPPRRKKRSQPTTKSPP